MHRSVLNAILAVITVSSGEGGFLLAQSVTQTAARKMPEAKTQQAAACKDRPEFRQLDFWLGDWEVFNKDQKLSNTRVEHILNDCALAETWQPVEGGHAGHGVSTYDPLTQKWEYFWVADNAYMSHWTGVLIDNEMRFATEQTRDGVTKLRRWSLIRMPNGSVRELSVGSSDGGKTWVTEYDFMWRRIGT
jgi:hypothetical protein